MFLMWCPEVIAVGMNSAANGDPKEFSVCPAAGSKASVLGTNKGQDSPSRFTFLAWAGGNPHGQIGQSGAGSIWGCVNPPRNVDILGRGGGTQIHSEISSFWGSGSCKPLYPESSFTMAVLAEAHGPLPGAKAKDMSNLRLQGLCEFACDVSGGLAQEVQGSF